MKCRAGIPLTEAALERATASGLQRRLMLVAKAAAGADTFDHAAAQRLGVAIRTTPGANAAAVAELTVALMLDALRDVSRRTNALRDGSWSAAIAGLPAGGLADAWVGLVGSGAIARRVAELVHAFGAEVWVFGSPRFTTERAAGWPGRRTESLAELLAGCDVVSVHVPATAETEGLIGERELRPMRPGSVLINTARAKVVPEEALDRALRDADSAPWRAAVDVFEVEGPGFTSVLSDNPVIVIVLQIPVGRLVGRQARPQAVMVLAGATIGAGVAAAGASALSSGPLSLAVVWLAVVLFSLAEVLFAAATTELLFAPELASHLSPSRTTC
ncbi:NAD(P)-dependent oxidoreductase [Streptomyces fagopyri]|uniref:NAD(P)-dependent oxidoreductase n=1 Tax=Streptomyces fagopyri TaxID=2662397 RepID=UPI00380CB429